MNVEWRKDRGEFDGVKGENIEAVMYVPKMLQGGTIRDWKGHRQ